MPAPELYASRCCGTVFTPGHGPDNIVEVTIEDRDREPSDPEVQRKGFCPACGHREPYMDLLGVATLGQHYALERRVEELEGGESGGE